MTPLLRPPEPAHPPRSREEVLEAADNINRMALEAMAARSSFTITYRMSRQPEISDLAAMEKAINGWLVGLVRMIGKEQGIKIPRNYKWLRFRLESAEVKDDGDHTVTITVDFATLLPEPAHPEAGE